VVAAGAVIPELNVGSVPAPADYPYGGPGVEQRTRTL
jgi:hypothetical protein